MLTAQMRRTLEEIGLGEIWRQEGIEKGIEQGKLEGIEEVHLSAARAPVNHLGGNFGWR